MGRAGVAVATILLFYCIASGSQQVLYIEDFSGEGDVNLVGWTGVYDAGGSKGGVGGGICWVWHKGDCENLIYTTEYLVDTTTCSNIEFKYDLARHSYYSSTPETSIAVRVGGSWYVSKTIYTSTSTTFATQTLVYNPNKENWDTLDVVTAARGSTASADLSGDITGFGLYSNSQNLGSSCTAEYDNFTITDSLSQKSADFNGDGVVDFHDYAAMANAWLTGANSPDYNETYDLYDDNNIDIRDLALFAQDWLLGAKYPYPYIPVETHREKISFNTGWKFYKGNAGAAFEHVAMEEVGTVQGYNNWYFAASSSNTGPRDSLMSLVGTTWRYSDDSGTCYIYDGRASVSSDPDPYSIKMGCWSDASGPIPRLEWVSSHPNNATVTISGTFMPSCSINGQKVRILHNGTKIWESPAVDAQYYRPDKSTFSVEIPDLNNGDIITFMPSAYVANLEFCWMHITITESASDLNSPGDIGFDDSSWQAVSLPHNPVMDPLWPNWPTVSYKGPCWYRKHFNLDPNYIGEKIFLELEAGNVATDIWLNATQLTSHLGGYLPIILDITDYVNFGATENVISVKVNNLALLDRDVPGWNDYGGIYRDVWLHVTDKLHVTDAIDANIVAGGGIFVTYPYVSDSQAQVQVKTHVKNEYPITKSCAVKTYIVDANNMVVAQSFDTGSIPVASDHTFTQLITVLKPSLWHPDHPYLYTVFTEAYDGETALDSFQTRIGIRTIEFTKENGFKINGERLKFIGANRMGDYPYIGYAMGNLGQRRDAKLLREAGFQYVRCSHFPMDPAFLDACDEFGIMIGDTLPSGHHYVGSSTFEQISYRNVRDVIRRDRNHPCVIVWELYLNETDMGTTFCQNAVDIGHAEYPGPECYASGWKYDYIYDIYQTTAWAKPGRAYDGPLPLLIHAHGHWDYGGTSSTSDVHRGDGEAAMLQQAWNHQESHHLDRAIDKLCGDTLWIGIDYVGWPSGAMDKFRLPKFSYYFWQSQRDPNLIIPGIDSGPVVYIANYWTSTSPHDINVFSNCDEVKLYINSVLQGTHTPNTGYPNLNLLHPPFSFTGLTWVSGELKAEGYIGGQLVATHIVRTPDEANTISIKFDADKLISDGSDMAFVYASVVDANGTVVPEANNMVTFDVTGPAALVSPSTVRAEAGIATALLRALTQPGQVTVTATATGLSSGNASINSVMGERVQD